MTILDASRTRPSEGGASFSFRNRLVRALWTIVWLVGASWTPRKLNPWRVFLLRRFGARIEAGVEVRGGARIWLPSNLVMARGSSMGPGVNCYTMATITIGAETIVSQGAHLCAGSHDIADPDFQLFARPITIGARAWIAAEAFVGPGVVIGDGAVLGARGVAMRPLDAWTVYSGNPAQPIRPRILRARHPA